MSECNECGGSGECQECDGSPSDDDCVCGGSGDCVICDGTGEGDDDPELRRYVAMVDEQIALWKRDKITAQEAWYSLTYERREFANWAMVEDFCIGWLQGQRRRGRPVPVENVA